MEFLQEALVYLAAAVIAVPVCKKLGLGSVLGYLTAGVVIGPWGIGLIGEVERVLEFAEFGVVLLLFLIGLELQLPRLWELRRLVFGLGGAQVALSTLALGTVAIAMGLPTQAAYIIGAALSLSSTALAMQLLAERSDIATPYGRAAFGILLFQDLAVIPLLAVLPILGTGNASGPAQPGWLVAVKTLIVLAAVVGSRFLLRPLLRIVASLRTQEVFTATALAIVMGTALAVSKVGLSMALGAFLAGVLLADSEYRHELEADIEPFKGLLLGLFFIAVGMSVNVPLFIANPVPLVAAVFVLVSVKSCVLLLLGRTALRERPGALNLAVLISQGGEFAFVLFNLSVGYHIIEQHLADQLVAVVSLSMAVTPFLSLFVEKVCLPRLQPVKSAYDVAPTEETPVIIAGMGRVGQIVARILRAKHVPFTAMDIDPEHIEFIKKFGTNKVFYGDAARLDLLRAARADTAQLLVVAVDDIEASMRIVDHAKRNFPHLTIVARARNRVHAYRLMNEGLEHVVRETLAGSLEITERVLSELGLPFSEVASAIKRFSEHDEQLMQATYKHLNDEKRLREISARARQELESLFEQDAKETA